LWSGGKRGNKRTGLCGVGGRGATRGTGFEGWGVVGKEVTRGPGFVGWVKVGQGDSKGNGLAWRQIGDWVSISG
jgi:hypothetical protein